MLKITFDQYFKALLLPITLIATLVNIYLNSSSVGLPCVFKTFFGFECFGCGISRAIIAIWKGNFELSYHENRVGVVVFLVIFLISFNELYLILYKKRKSING